MKLTEIFPVAISVAVIILIAVLEKQSKLVAAVTATMPVTIPLSLWIVYSSTQGEKLAVEQFTRGLATGIWPTVAFTLAVWLASRAGWKLLPIIAAGYTTWGATLLLLVGVQRILGMK
ncbi:MAG: hypothetical protein AB1894_24565 [Chloroflexota bacterium]